MQTFVVIVSALVATALAQWPSGFPQCGIDCVANMLGQAAALGCPNSDPTCLCRNVNFGYGIRDCSVQHCQNPALYSQVISYGNAYCSSAGVIISAPTATGTLTAVAPTSTNANTITGAPTPISTAPVLTTITGTDGSETVSTIGSTTILAPGSGSPIPAGGAATVSPIVTTVTGEDGSATVSTIGSTTVPLSGFATSTTVPVLSTVTDNGTTTVVTAGSTVVPVGSTPTTPGGAETTSTSIALAAAKTAAPAGLLAAAGLAVIFL